MPDRLPSPGPSFVREQDTRIGEQRYQAGMARPTSAPDDWWLAVLWVTDGEGVIPFRAVAPQAGPPPDPPLLRLGPALAGGLSGFIREEDGRLAFQIGPIAPPDDQTRPWRIPLAVRVALKWEPVRAASMRPNELAETMLTAFRRAVEDLARP